MEDRSSVGRGRGRGKGRGRGRGARIKGLNVLSDPFVPQSKVYSSEEQNQLFQGPSYSSAIQNGHKNGLPKHSNTSLFQNGDKSSHSNTGNGQIDTTNQFSDSTNEENCSPVGSSHPSNGLYNEARSGNDIGKTMNGRMHTNDQFSDSKNEESCSPVVSLQHSNGSCNEARSMNGISNGICKELVKFETERQVIFPRRPDYGKLGREIKVKVNYFPITIPDDTVYQYDVKIMPLNKEHKETGKRVSKETARKIIDKLSRESKEFHSCLPAFDGKATIITKKQLFSKLKSFTVILDKDEFNDTKSFKVEIVPSKEEPFINLNELHRFIAGKTTDIPSRAIMALGIIMRTGLNLKLLPVGRSLFQKPDPNNLHPLGGGKELWFGYYQSVRPTAWKMMVNVDRSACVFNEKQQVIDFICQALDIKVDRELNAQSISVIQRELKGLKIKVTHQQYPRKYTIIGLTKVPISTLSFEMNENNNKFKINVVDYFKRQYNKNLKYGHLPALNVGSKDQPKYLPLEFCEIIEGQPYKKKLAEQQTTNMIRMTSQPPAQRFREIEDAARSIVKDNEKYMKEFGLQMNTKCTELSARILPPPKVAYDNNKKIIPKCGFWDMKDLKFLESIEIQNWILLSTVRSCNNGQLNEFKNMLKKVGGNMGIKVAEPKDIQSIPLNNIVNSLRNYVKKCKIDLAIIVLPNKTSSVYSDIKTVCEIEIGLKTQCVKERNVRKCKDSLISNLWQKINAKLGGINCALNQEEKPEIFNSPVIFLGADVTHPSPGDKTSFSIAAVVGSLDRHPSRYAASVRIQRPHSENKRRVEIIVDLKAMVKEILRQFYRNTRQKKPEKIIFYRDGVSEGEFPQVQDKEISQIRDACRELEAGYEPGITYVVVGKRHHMRMMPSFQKDGVGGPGNVPPGTAVDTVITHPTDFDFFLCSHYGIQGTSRPAHYTVLWDDNDFKSDELQKLSYYLCHVYARCTRSISIPSPVQYAHLAAARAKQHVISQTETNGSSSNSSNEISNFDINLDVTVVNAFKNSMYFV